MFDQQRNVPVTSELAQQGLRVPQDLDRIIGPIEAGVPVAFVSTSVLGVPKLGVVNVADVVSAMLPDPLVARLPSTPAAS